MTTKTLLTVVINGVQTWIRSVLLDEPSSSLQEDLTFYYGSLLHLGSVHVTIKSQQVPCTFPLSLLGSIGQEPPRTFPSYDKEVTTKEEEEKYLALIDRVAEMERMRSECGITGFKESTSSPTEPKQPTRYQSWVYELLATLEQKDVWTEDTSTIPEDDTIAWVLTPLLAEVREKKGCRILTDPVLGRIWASRLGTELYPDLAVCRRLSTIRWRVNSARSAELARVAIEWYIEAQVLERGETGLSPWIQRADEDLASVLLPFQNLGPRQTFARPQQPKEERKHPLTTILQTLEGTHVLSSLTHSSVYALTTKQWESYLRHVFRMYGIGTDVIDAYWAGVEDVIQLWVRGNQGVDVGNGALFASWEIVWGLLIQGRTSSMETRFQHFLDTLDSHDPITALGMKFSQKMDIAKIWINMFVEKELIPDSNSRLNSSILYEGIRTYVLKYLSLSFADSLLKPANIGPQLALCGYPVARTKQGRVIAGVRYRNPLDYLPASAVKAPVGASIVDVMQNEAKHDSFRIVTNETIHLGSL